MLAWIVIGKEPAVAGVPARVAVFAPALVASVTPEGRDPAEMVKVAAGEPVAVTVKVPAAPTENVVALPLVIEGATATAPLRIS